MEKYMIVVAGGSGKRMGGDIPKQFMPIHGKPLLMRTIECIHTYDANIGIILVLPESQMSYWELLCQEYEFGIPCKVVAGGSERFYSVKNALDYVPDNCLVGVHDGVRPFVSSATLDALFSSMQASKATIPVVPPHESIRIANAERTAIVDRNTVKLVQTPQCFHSSVLKRAYNSEYKPIFTDDASVVEIVLGVPISLVEGNRENIKITTPFDIVVAEAIYENYNF